MYTWAPLKGDHHHPNFRPSSSSAMVKIKCGLWNNFSILSTYQQNFFSSAMVKIKCGFWNKCQHINESLPHQPWWRRNDHHHHDYHRDFANSYNILLVMIINMYIKCHYHRFTDHDNHRDFANNNQKWPAGKGFEPHCRQCQSTSLSSSSSP